MLTSLDICAKKSELVSTLSAKFLQKFPTYPAGKFLRPFVFSFYTIYLLEAEKNQIQTFFVIRYLPN